MPTTDAFLRRLRLRAPNGAPVDVFLEDWAQVDEVAADATATHAALRHASEALPRFGGLPGEARSLASAVVGADGGLCFTDPAFERLFPHPPHLADLIRGARRGGVMVGVLEGPDETAFIAWVGPAAAAARWPLPNAAQAALRAGADRLAVVVSAPSRSLALTRRAAQALDLTAPEAALAEAMLFAPNLESAAAAIGIGRETARDALKRVMLKAGARRTPELVGRLVEIMCASQSERASDEEVAQNAFGLTPAEARAAVLIARGATGPRAAKALGLSAETVKTHTKAIFRKTGIQRAKDLARLVVEARELVIMADATHPDFADPVDETRLRIVPADQADRRIALLDYGPYGASPVFIFHGPAAGRRLPPGYLSAIQALGYRPLVVQRPGFGLSDPAERGTYVRTAVQDMVTVTERLRLGRVAVLGRETGTPIAMAFAALHPDLVGRTALLGPHPPISAANRRRTFVAMIQDNLLFNSAVSAPFAELLRRQSSPLLLERMIRQSCEGSPVDTALLDADPSVLRFLIRDIQALSSRSIQGFIDEHAVYANGWEPTSEEALWPWVVGVNEAAPGAQVTDWMTSDRVEHLPGAGILSHWTHANQVANLLRSNP